MPETAAWQWKAIFDPADAGHRVSVDHTVQMDAAPYRFHQVGQGLPLQDRSLCTRRHQTKGQKGSSLQARPPIILSPQACPPDPRGLQRLVLVQHGCAVNAAGMANSLRVSHGVK